MNYLRQLTRQAVGQRLPGQPRPLRPSDPLRSSAGSMDAGYDESTLEMVVDEMEGRRREPDPLATPSATPGTLQAPTPSLAASSLSAEGSMPVRSARDQAPDANPIIRRAADPAATPAITRFDSLEALLPAILEPRRASQEAASIESAGQRPSQHHDAHEQRTPAPEGRRDANVPSRTPASQAARLDVARRREPEAAVAPAVPDVHIHIGRVELTALQPPPPRPAPRREEKKPMSLDEYLKQRDGRRS